MHTYTGRTLRINKDGSIPKDNPFLNDPTAPPDTYDFGHRDPEGAALNPTTGKLWVIEHGPLGGDKISIIKPGGNYGWPNVSYGRRYNGDLIAGKGLTQAPGVEQPVYFWYPDIAPCALIFYTGDMFPEWKGNVLVGGLGAQAMIRLVLNADGTKVIAEERLLHDLHQRVRELEQAPDGSIYSFARRRPPDPHHPKVAPASCWRFSLCAGITVPSAAAANYPPYLRISLWLRVSVANSQHFRYPRRAMKAFEIPTTVKKLEDLRLTNRPDPQPGPFRSSSSRLRAAALQLPRPRPCRRHLPLRPHARHDSLLRWCGRSCCCGRERHTLQTRRPRHSHLFPNLD